MAIGLAHPALHHPCCGQHTGAVARSGLHEGLVRAAAAVALGHIRHPRFQCASGRQGVLDLAALARAAKAAVCGQAGIEQGRAAVGGVVQVEHAHDAVLRRGGAPEHHAAPATAQADPGLAIHAAAAVDRAVGQIDRARLQLEVGREAAAQIFPAAYAPARHAVEVGDHTDVILPVTLAEAGVHFAVQHGVRLCRRACRCARSKQAAGQGDESILHVCLQSFFVKPLACCPPTAAPALPVGKTSRCGVGVCWSAAGRTARGLNWPGSGCCIPAGSGRSAPRPGRPARAAHRPTDGRRPRARVARR